MEVIFVDYLEKIKEEFNYSLSMYIRALSQIGGRELSTSVNDLYKTMDKINKYTDIYLDKITEIRKIVISIKHKKLNKESYKEELEVLKSVKL
jgi:hypothetical protein